MMTTMPSVVETNVTGWTRLFFKKFPCVIKIAISGSKFCQILKMNPQKVARIIKFCKGGEISLNLVTLVQNYPLVLY